MKIPAIITKVLTDYFRWLAIGLALIVMIVGYVFLIAPKLSEVQSSQVTQQKAAENDLKIKQERVIELKKSNDKFAAVLPANRRQAIDDFLPSSADFPGLLLTVKNIVAQSNLTLNSISIGQGGQVAVTAGAAATPAASPKTETPSASAATVSGVNVKTQDISVTVSGASTYDAVKTFLANIESSRRLFDVVSVSFSSATTTDEGSATAASWALVLRSYYLPSI